MKKCPNCGSEVAEEAKFCTNCGNELATGDEVKPKAVASEVQSENASEQAKESASKQEAGVSLDKEKLKASSLSYWSWLVTAWKHPFEAPI
ncbi:zinc-ribbon domain-containing protein [Ligilactobacillus agilis]|uniref:zinc-ribbon domain-containing protein n=1 Tax=Ligilactobacillus agilis TaxID=1601 RepID=UPI001866D3F0|nr:zinc ribbon domain-containing protein [Ligilactobacillus agilis]